MAFVCKITKLQSSRIKYGMKYSEFHKPHAVCCGAPKFFCLHFTIPISLPTTILYLSVCKAAQPLRTKNDTSDMKQC